LVEAELVMGLSERLKVPPVAGGAVDQPLWVLLALHILDLASGDSGESRPAGPPRIELADLQQLTDVPALAFN
jgi:hypothetical protein